MSLSMCLVCIKCKKELYIDNPVAGVPIPTQEQDKIIDFLKEHSTFPGDIHPLIYTEDQFAGWFYESFKQDEQ